MTALISLAGASGCGAFITEGGIFPLPTVHLVVPTPAEYGLAFETVEIESPTGPMFGWFIPVDNARGTVMINHGAVYNRSQYLSHYQLFHELGYHVFAYDYQGFGENFNIATINNVLRDATAALSTLKARTEPGTERIVMFGMSMGTLPTLAMAAQSPERIVGIMLEGSFVQESLPPTAFLALGIVPSPIAYTRIPSELNPQAHLPNIKIPKLFLQSRDDEVTPFDSARELYDLASEPKFFVPLSGLHIYSILVDENYRPRIQEFLDAVTAD